MFYCIPTYLFIKIRLRRLDLADKLLHLLFLLLNVVHVFCESLYGSANE